MTPPLHASRHDVYGGTLVASQEHALHGPYRGVTVAPKGDEDGSGGQSVSPAAEAGDAPEGHGRAVEAPQRPDTSRKEPPGDKGVARGGPPRHILTGDGDEVPGRVPAPGDLAEKVAMDRATGVPDAWLEGNVEVDNGQED